MTHDSPTAQGLWLEHRGLQRLIEVPDAKVHACDESAQVLPAVHGVHGTGALRPPCPQLLAGAQTSIAPPSSIQSAPTWHWSPEGQLPAEPQGSRQTVVKVAGSCTHT